jgi:hypothetical protein
LGYIFTIEEKQTISKLNDSCRTVSSESEERAAEARAVGAVQEKPKYFYKYVR